MDGVFRPLNPKPYNPKPYFPGTLHRPGSTESGSFVIPSICSASFSAVTGIDFIRTPTASKTALDTIGAAGIIVCSPTPRAPNGPSGCGVSMMIGTIHSGISSAVGIL